MGFSKIVSRSSDIAVRSWLPDIGTRYIVSQLMLTFIPVTLFLKGMAVKLKPINCAAEVDQGQGCVRQ